MFDHFLARLNAESTLSLNLVAHFFARLFENYKYLVLYIFALKMYVMRFKKEFTGKSVWYDQADTPASNCCCKGCCKQCMKAVSKRFVHFYG